MAAEWVAAGMAEAEAEGVMEQGAEATAQEVEETAQEVAARVGVVRAAAEVVEVGAEEVDVAALKVALWAVREEVVPMVGAVRARQAEERMAVVTHPHCQSPQDL